MHRSTILLISFLSFVGIANSTSEQIEHTLTVTCAPLQAYNALAIGWQIQQWSYALSAHSEAHPGGLRTVAYDTSDVEQGVFLETDPGLLLSFTYMLDGAETKARITFQQVDSGTVISLTQTDFGTDDSSEVRKEKMLHYWKEKFALLTDYLNHIPGGYVARPVGAAPFPGVLLLHDRYGLNRTTRSLADSLARNGYLVIAVDMFKGEVTGDSTQAQGYLDLAKDEESIASVLNGFESLRNREDVLPKRIAVWGMGYGGSIATWLATMENKLRGCVNWYGRGLPEPEMLGRIACPVLSFFGDRDATMPAAAIENYNRALIQAGVQAKTIPVRGGQGFADPASAENYNAATVLDSWHQTLMFLDKQLR
jgi:carboxymethylenebutenolidase